jgi:copper chaperone CopZ
MKTLKFKTNINCSACVAKAKPFLDSVQHIQSWEVDTANPEKILTVRGDDIKAGDVVAQVKQAGYKIEEKKGLLGSLFK